MHNGTPVGGRYRLDRLIASGGMGEVWRGFDPQLHRPVAIKILHGGLDDAQRPGDRFDREAKILANLRGPGLVEVYDYGEDRSGRLPVRYIVMELVEGTTLTSLLGERGRLSPAETLAYMAATAEALECAHARGVVHRDIKPGNLLIEPEGRLRVVDFGISLADGEARLTAPRGILGTLSYVSPEQLSGREVCGLADLYSLGAVAYECLAGAPPFTAEDSLDVVHMHLHEDPPPLPGDVPTEVADIVLRCLRKRPEDRWRSGAELAAACRAAAGAAAAEPAARLPLYLAALALALVAIGGLTVWQPWKSAQADHQAPDDPVAAAEPTPSGSEPASVAPTDDAEPAPTPSEAEPSTGPDPTPEPEPTSASPDVPDEPPPAGEALPDVIGMQAAEARTHLQSMGWREVDVASTLLYAGAPPQGCQIVSQSPSPRTYADYDETVTISYYGLRDCR